MVVVGPLPCLWRAPTDNDEYGGYAERWRRAGLDADSTARVVEAVTLSLSLTLTLTITLIPTPNPNPSPSPNPNSNPNPKLKP